MALITRVARLFRADLHAVLDRVEEPDVLLRQAVREMEECLAQDRQTLKLLQHEGEQLAARARELAQTRDTLNGELEICLDAGKEELARPLMKRRLESERALQLLERRRETLRTKTTQLKERLQENQLQYESMRQKADLLEEQGQGTSTPDSWSLPDIIVRDEDVEVALLRERQRRASS